MAPRIRKSVKSPVSTTSAPTATSEKEPPPALAAPTPAAPTAPATLPLVFLELPPADANIPAPPKGFVAGDTADYRAALPRDAELRALPIAAKDLARFTNYAQILGETAPPYAQVVQALTAASAWSSTRTESAAWDAFCGSQEGIAWTMLRAQMARLTPSFELASSGGSNLDTLFPGLATLLGAKKVIARKGASTRKLNTKATAEGKEPTHGVVGKARQKRAEKAAYAATGAASAATAAATTIATTQPAAASASPASVSPGAAPAVAAPPASTPANGTPHP
jgi:hypothetical protein